METLTINSATPEQVILEKMDGKELIAHMIRGEKIASGGLSNIYSVKIKIGEKEFPYILKEYISGEPEKDALNAFENYKEAKKPV